MFRDTSLVDLRRHERLPRIATINDRVRSSETFPRIRDAEKEMIENEKKFRIKIENREKRRKKKRELERLMLLKKAMPQDNKILPSLKPKEEIQQKQYFTKFILNRDPQSSKYLLFDEVFYPKLFDKEISDVPPEMIDRVWLIGFQDLATR
jgi:hypothetical protein